MKNKGVMLLIFPILLSSCGKEKNLVLLGNYSSTCVNHLLEYGKFHFEFTKENMSSSDLYRLIDQNASYYYKGAKHSIVSIIKDADKMVLSWGINEFSSAFILKKEFETIEIDEDIFSVKLEYFDYYIHHIVDAVHAYNTKAKIYLMGLYNPFTLPFPEEKLMDTAIYKINQCMEDMKGKNTIYISTISLKNMTNAEALYADIIWEYMHE